MHFFIIFYTIKWIQSPFSLFSILNLITLHSTALFGELLNCDLFSKRDTHGRLARVQLLIGRHNYGYLYLHVANTFE